jgi:signal transduction histidine kinase
MGNGVSNLRKDYFIKKWLQFRFSLIFIIAIIFANTAFGIFVLRRTKTYLDYYLYTSHTKISNTWEVISPVLIKTSFWSLIVLLIIFLILIYLITKRFSDGFSIFAKDIKLLRTGVLLSDFKVSKPEEVKKLSENYKEVKKYLQESISESKESVIKLGSILNKLEDYINAKDKEGVSASLKELESGNRRLQDMISKINIL